MKDIQSSPEYESRWKSLLEKNIGWIVAASIWLTHLLR
jgi:hypothetical protein